MAPREETRSVETISLPPVFSVRSRRLLLHAAADLAVLEILTVGVHLGVDENGMERGVGFHEELAEFARRETPRRF